MQKEKSWLHPLLFICSRFYLAGAFFRKRLYTHLFSPFRSSAFVISVGSPVAGGSGKTPIVLWLLQHIGSEKCAVITRGYRSKGEKAKRPLIVEEHNPDQFGDEAVLIKKKAPHAMVIVGKKRSRSLRIAEKRKKIAILDDGMQHWPVDRDVEIVTVKEEDLQPPERYLPRGFLREPFTSFARADLVFFEGKETKPIKKYTKAPIVHIERVLEEPLLSDGSLCEIRRGSLFCAIARPESFLASVKKLGFSVVYHQFFADHDPFSKSQIENLWKENTKHGGHVLFCTEKDWVKVPKIEGIPIAYFPLSLRVIKGIEHVNKFI
ncbi:MAG: tetraacyldisaccharide 4'-kinase [Chlamydiota bacterium]